MFYNYLLTALRNLHKQPVFSAIKVLSLVLGLVCGILVVMHVHYVQSSNKHINNWENTYRLVSHLKIRETNTPYRTRGSSEPFAPQLKLDYPGLFEYIAKVRPAGGVFSRNNQASEDSYYFAEPDAVYIFDLDFIQGDPATALTEPNMLVMTESAAEKYFGDDNPFGQTLRYNDSADLRVTGVIRDFPKNATHPMEIIISVPTGTQLFGQNFMVDNMWLTYRGSQTFITFQDRASAEQLSYDLADFVERNLPETWRPLATALDFGLSLQPINDIYLNPLNNFNAPENSTARTVLFGLVLFAVLITITSCINYMNLSLAQIAQRGKEIGVRKTLGAKRSQIVWQILLESLLLAGIALLIALPLVALVIPMYSSLTATTIVFFDIFQSNLAILLMLLVAVTGFIAGFFPAMSLSGIQAAAIIKGSFSHSRTGKLAKNSVTVMQFTVSTVLIILAIATYLQIEHLRNLDIGFNKNNLVVLDTRYNSREPGAFNYSAMKNEFLQHPGIISVAASSFSPPGTGLSAQWRLPSSDPDDTTSVVFGNVGVGFVETYGFELLAGRSFSEEFPADLLPASGPADNEHTYGIVITDLLVERFGIDSPDAAVGQIFMLGERAFRVVGVVRRFQYSSGMEDVEESIGILRGTEDPMRTLHIRINPVQFQEALAHIDNVWARHRSDIPLDRTILAQTLNNIIEARNSGLSTAALMASIITTGIAAFGLYALASYSSVRRTKEVGIRKVLGASSISIVSLLVWDFIKPVLASCLLAWPIAYYCVNIFYAGFTSQASFSIGWYLLVTAGVLCMTALTVIFQCLRTANSNPVLSLRYD